MIESIWSPPNFRFRTLGHFRILDRTSKMRFPHTCCKSCCSDYLIPFGSRHPPFLSMDFVPDICCQSDTSPPCQSPISGGPAYEADVNRTYISKLEKALTYVGLEIIGKLSAVLGIDPAEFLQRPAKKSAKAQGRLTQCSAVDIPIRGQTCGFVLPADSIQQLVRHGRVHCPKLMILGALSTEALVHL
jgi:hypothetical protein